MHIEHLTPQIPATSEDLRDLQKLEATIRNATADGKITRDELDTIWSVAWENGRIGIAELSLYRRLVIKPIAEGELEMDYWV